MISALTWVPKGMAAQNPQKFTMTEEEFAQITNQINDEVTSAQLGLSAAQEEEEMLKTEEVVDDELAKYDLDNYDEEEGMTGIPVFGSSKGLTYHQSNNEDPYIVMKDPEEDDKELMEEMEILPTDNLLLACRTEDDISHLEVYVYEQEQDNLYVHHDIMLPSFPICVEWMNFGKNETMNGNMVAIGTFEPEIEIWNLDTIDTMYPTMILGQESKKLSAKEKLLAKKKSKKSAQATVDPERHLSAVTCLSWNKTHRQLLLSGSADTTVKLWDLSLEKAVHSYHHHTDKVVSLAWHPTEATLRGRLVSSGGVGPASWLPFRAIWKSNDGGNR